MLMLLYFSNQILFGVRLTMPSSYDCISGFQIVAVGSPKHLFKSSIVHAKQNHNVSQQRTVFVNNRQINATFFIS